MLRFPASRRALPLPVGALLAVVLAALAAAPGEAATTRLRPSADGSARTTVAATRADHRRGLVVDGAPAVRSWLRFDVLRGRPVLALRLFVTAGPRRVAVRVRRGHRVVGRLARGRRGHWATIRLRRVGPAAARLRLTLTTRSRHRRGFASRESRHAPRLVVRGATVPAAGGPPLTTSDPPSAPIATTPAPATPAPGSVAPPALPAATRFVATSGQRRRDVHGDRALPEPRPRLSRRRAGGGRPGRRGRLRRADDHAGPGQGRDGMRTAARLAACVAFTPAAGATVTMPSLALGATYGVPGPAGVAVVATADRRLRTGELTLNRPRELATWGISAGNLYVTGGEHVALRGGDVGGVVSPDGTHPEIQRVYHSSPLIVPTDLTIEGVRFHDITTTHPSAHTDCLQIENGDGIVLRGNRFERCGSTGLRMSWGSDTQDGPPTHVLIENNVFGELRRHPGLAAVLLRGPGRHRDRRPRPQQHRDDAAAARGSAFYARNVRYVGNLAPGVGLREPT